MALDELGTRMLHSEEVAEAIFSYGPGRGDLSDAGDTFGMIKRYGAQWATAQVAGFKMYHDVKWPFPFTILTGNPEDLIIGTIMYWPGVEGGNRKAIEEEGKLTGYDAASPGTRLFARTVVDVLLPPDADPEIPRRAYFFFKENFDEVKLDDCKYYPLGDWLRPEEALSAQARKATAVFAYGTLRGDHSERGDMWGVIEQTQASWSFASVRGFRLYQDRDLRYPFAIRTDNDKDVVRGTLISWPNTEAYIAGLRSMDRIEGYRDDCPENGLYDRAVVNVDVADGTRRQAFLYHQSASDDQLSRCLYFEHGDWLKDARPQERARFG